MRLMLAVLTLALGWAVAASADDWGEVAQVSTTMGVQANRLCLGEASRGDLGCPGYAPYVNPTNGYVGFNSIVPTAPITISNSHNTDAIKFGPAGAYALGNDSGGGPYLKGIPYVSIRHVNNTVGAQFSTQYSGAAQLELYPMANQSGLLVRKGAGGTGDIALLVSSTGSVSINAGRHEPSTTLHVSGTIRMADGGETCDANRAGAMRWHAGAGQFQVCYGSGGWALLSSAAVSGTGSVTDRIVSGTTSVIASQDRSVTISTNGLERMVVGEDGIVRTNSSLSVNGTVVAQRYTINTHSGSSYWLPAATSSTLSGYQNLILANYLPTGNILLRPGGNVGISTTNPSKTLTVNGDAAVSGTVQVAGTGDESCGPALRGTIRQNPVTKKLEVCRY